MYHTSDIKRWVHGVHFPGHQTMVNIEHFLLNKKLWAIIGLVALTTGFILLMIWADKTGDVGGSSLPTPLQYPYWP